ncbi:MAG: putative nicotinate-nucleotide adenylyltransferase [Candidatus Hydrogenedentota bacterium]
MRNAQRIGVFGGTFDPIHNAHLDIGRAAVAQAGLDRLLFVVAGEPPHKRDATFAPAEDRYRLVEAALEGEAHMEASRIELDRSGPSYTTDTLSQLHEQYPEADLFLVLGMDALIDLPRWRHPKRILDLAELLVVPRPGEWEIPDAVKGRFHMLEFARTDISSTEVRRRIADGESLEGLVPPAVANLIVESGVYRSGPVDA